MVVIVKCSVGHLFARMSHSIPRAAPASCYCTACMSIVPMGRWPKVLNRLSEERTTKIYDTFSEDLPERDSFHQEVNLWIRKWSKFDNACIPKDISSLLGRINEKSFPNICTILKLLAITVVTTATVERGNSALKYVKTSLRPQNSMGQERLNALMLLYIRKDLALDYDAVIDIFVRKNPRKMLFLNPVGDK